MAISADPAAHVSFRVRSDFEDDRRMVCIPAGTALSDGGQVWYVMANSLVSPGSVTCVAPVRVLTGWTIRWYRFVWALQRGWLRVVRWLYSKDLA
jgi:hypothetical protein